MMFLILLLGLPCMDPIFIYFVILHSVVTSVQEAVVKNQNRLKWSKEVVFPRWFTFACYVCLVDFLENIDL